MPETSFDVLVIGAGPAGIAAASAAASVGAKVGVVDENSTPGGQIYRASMGKMNSEFEVAIKTHMELGHSLDIHTNTTIIDGPAPGVLIGQSTTGITKFEYKKLVLAVGARELFIPFPGWTLPNVMGVGGLQALVKGGMDVRGKRVVVAGSGPLLIAVGAYLKQHGAHVLAIAEQASTARLAKFGLTLARYPTKMKQGASLLVGVGRLIQRDAWVERADGINKLESVKLNKSRGKVQCDYLACAFGFVPNLELPALLGCEIEDGFVAVDENQLTSVADVYCAGEPTGIGGIELSSIEGAIAGYAAADSPTHAQELFGDREKWRFFARELDRTFALRPELKDLCSADTMVCRCEDVSAGELAGWSCGREAKLHTRCGMGPCQGRICGPATRFLYGWEHGTVRPPLAPTPLAGLEYDNSTERDTN